MKSHQPIGIFDSGIGGLTVAKTVKKYLPNESIIYFGDTAHLPYGDKSMSTIQTYSIKIAEFLLKKKCKIILIACNSASSAAYALIKEYVGTQAIIFDVINPTISYIKEYYHNCKIGLIGTKQTVFSGIYASKIKSINQSLDFVALPTSLLVPVIEENFHVHHQKITRDIIREYLRDTSLDDIKSLILGCTHYPIIKNYICEYYDDQSVEVIDSSEITAKSLHFFLHHNQLLSEKKSQEDEFFVSEFTPMFENTTLLFFGNKVKLQKHSLWE